MRRLVLSLVGLLIAIPVIAQSQEPTDWAAMAEGRRNQRDAALDAVIQLQIAAAKQTQADAEKLAWWGKCVSEPVCVTWVNSGAVPAKSAK
jgi:hypothetical protein